MSRLSKMLLLNMASAKRWKFSRPSLQSVCALFMQSHSLSQMIELLGSAYGLTSAPREWFDDSATTLRKFGARQSKSDPCLRTVADSSGVVIGLLGVHVHDVLFSGDEGSSTCAAFLHDLHSAYKCPDPR